MSAKKKEPPVKRVSSKPGRPATYQEWALWRMRLRPGNGLENGKRKQIVGCGSRALHRPPMYLELAPIVNGEYDQLMNGNLADDELRRMRDEGLITCTDGWWWRRQPHKLKVVK